MAGLENQVAYNEEWLERFYDPTAQPLGNIQMSRSRYTTWVIVIGILLFIGSTATVWSFTVDDSFITFRYAANLSAGYGPVYNPGAAPAEGYTTFLWMLVMTIPYLLNIDAVLFSKIVGVLATIGCSVVIYRYVTFLLDNNRRLPAALAALFFVGFPATAVHAVSGMETALFTLLFITLLYLFSIYAADQQAPTAALISLLCLLAGLTRPESNLAAGVTLLYFLLTLPKASRWQLVKWVGLLYVLPGAVYFVWRYFYYGQLLPLPYYVKVVTPVLLGGRYEVATFGLYLVVHIGIIALLSLTKIDRRLIPSFICTAVVGLFFLFPAHEMGFEWRYLFPLVPFACVIGGLGIAVLEEWMYQLNIRGSEMMSLVAGIMIVAGMVPDMQRALERETGYAEGLNAAHVWLGKRLANCEAGTDDPILAIGDAGAVPYYSGWQTIDTFGLNDPVIATTGVHDPQYVLGQNPDVLILISLSDEEFNPHLPWEADLYRAAVEAGMNRMGTRKFIDFYYLWLFVAPHDQAVGACLAD